MSKANRETRYNATKNTLRARAENITIFLRMVIDGARNPFRTAGYRRRETFLNSAQVCIVHAEKARSHHRQNKRNPSASQDFRGATRPAGYFRSATVKTIAPGFHVSMPLRSAPWYFGNHKEVQDGRFFFGKSSLGNHGGNWPKWRDPEVGKIDGFWFDP